MLIHSVEEGDAARFCGLTITVGLLERWLAAGKSEADLGLDTLREVATRVLGDRAWALVRRLSRPDWRAVGPLIRLLTHHSLSRTMVALFSLLVWPRRRWRNRYWSAAGAGGCAANYRDIGRPGLRDRLIARN